MITSLHIENFKCPRDVRVELKPLTVVIGKNDTGKSSLLEAMTTLANLSEWEVESDDALAPETPIQALPDPEGLDGRPGTDRHPKQVFRSLVRRASAEVAAPYDEVARRVRLDLLERRCKFGFAPFAEEVRRRCT
jgi:ABC-type cobalamin/Fe3+-siderophores transport system ATPase subunit